MKPSTGCYLLGTYQIKESLEVIVAYGYQSFSWGSTVPELGGYPWASLPILVAFIGYLISGALLIHWTHQKEEKYLKTWMIVTTVIIILPLLIALVIIAVALATEKRGPHDDFHGLAQLIISRIHHGIVLNLVFNLVIHFIFGYGVSDQDFRSQLQELPKVGSGDDQNVERA